MTRKIKEKPSASRAAKEKIQAAPKELLRRGLLTGAEKLQGQLRDAAEGGRWEDTEADRAQAATRTAAHWTVYRLKKLAPGKKRIWTGRLGTHADVNDPPSDDSAPDFPAGDSVPGSPAGKPDTQNITEPVWIKTREAADRSFPVESRRPDPPRAEPLQIKTRNACVRSQATAPAHEPVIENNIQSERQAAYTPDRSCQKFVRERVRNISVRQTEGQHQSNRVVSVPARESYGGNMFSRTIDTAEHGPAPEPDGQLPQPLEQGRQKFVRERQKKTAAQRMEKQRGPKVDAPAQQLDGGSAQPNRISTLPAQDEKRTMGNTVQGTVSDDKHRIKDIRSERKAVGRGSRQSVKAANSSKLAANTSKYSSQAAQQTVRVAVQTRQRAVEAAVTTRKTVTTVDKPVARAAVSALRGAVSAIRASLAPLGAGGGAVIAVVLVLCLVGSLLLSPLGIFFSGEDNGGQTIAAVVREINQEYDARLEEIKAGVAYDEVSLSGARVPWYEILAIYAVKTTSDPANGQEVVTMNDKKKELLKQVFWDMNELSSFTSTVPGEGDDDEGTTTLHITVTAKTAGEMADVYDFNADQRRQLSELLSNEYRELWNAVLYGIGTGSGEIVAMALSQVGNVGGQPYWSWYGFSSRVDWCAIFVSWCANECGYIDAGVVPKFAGCVQGSRWFKDRGLWQDKDYTPNPGDIIFFDWDDPGGFSGLQDGVPDHVGIVERVENGRVYTVEGNSGDKCCQRSYPLGYYEIYGYGIV